MGEDTSLTNWDRARHGHEAVMAGDPEYRQGRAEDNVSHALANILHYAGTVTPKVDFDRALVLARQHHEQEVIYEDWRSRHGKGGTLRNPRGG